MVIDDIRERYPGQTLRLALWHNRFAFVRMGFGIGHYRAKFHRTGFL